MNKWAPDHSRKEPQDTGFQIGAVSPGDRGRGCFRLGSQTYFRVSQVKSPRSPWSVGPVWGQSTRRPPVHWRYQPACFKGQRTQGLGLGRESPVRVGSHREWIPAAVGGEGPTWPDPERKGLPRGLTLQSSQEVGNTPGSKLLPLAAPSHFPFYRKEKEGKGCECWPGSQKPGCGPSGNSRSPGPVGLASTGQLHSQSERRSPGPCPPNPGPGPSEATMTPTAPLEGPAPQGGRRRESTGLGVEVLAEGGTFLT